MKRAIGIIALIVVAFTAGASRRPWSYEPVPDGFVRYVLPADRQVYIHCTNEEHWGVHYLELFIEDYPEQKLSDCFSAWQFYGAVQYKVPHASWWKLEEDSGYLMPVEIYDRVAKQPGKVWGPLPEELPIVDHRVWQKVEAKQAEGRNR